MKLSKIYSNEPKLFEPINFNSGLNVILAEIRDPKNLEKDTHNLGKSLLASLLDFCFLKGQSLSFFIFKHQDLFENFVFFLELELTPTKYLTIRRFASEETHSKIAFKWHKEKQQDFAFLADEQWDHHDVAFDKARTMLDGYLDFRVIDGWNYRDAIAYSLRGQDDYSDVYKLDKFRGQHKEWKPYIAHILGLDASLAIESYSVEEKSASKTSEINDLKSQLTGLSDQLDKINALLEIKQNDVEKIEEQISQYDFEIADENINRELVDELESKISHLNETRYNLSMNERKITKSLKEKISFDLSKVKEVFEEAEVYFPEQIVKDYEDLLSFNKAISDERRKYLKAELKDIKAELSEVQQELATLSHERSVSLETLKDSDTFSKYKKLNSSLVGLKADIEGLERQISAIGKLNKKKKELRELNRRKDLIKDKMQDDIDNRSASYKSIGKRFSEIIKTVLNKTAVLSTKVNKQANLDFFAEFINAKGQETSQSDGTTYKKLLCIAYDMAVLGAYLGKKFTHFVYHDGVFENLDDRKSLKLIEVMRADENRGLQQIITLIDSDIPKQPDGKMFKFEEYEVVKTLHDMGDDGRLFKMREW